VGKTTLTCLLGYYLAQRTGQPVLLFDIDAQCTLSLAVGFDPDQVSKNELTIYNLVKPSGRVTLAVVAPYVDRRGGAQRSGVLTQEEISDLTAFKDRPEALRDGLDKLGLRDLQVLAEAIRQPVRPKITAAALRAACFERIRAEECWRRISSGV
jgi:hypothetical protein